MRSARMAMARTRWQQWHWRRAWLAKYRLVDYATENSVARLVRRGKDSRRSVRADRKAWGEGRCARGDRAASRCRRPGRKWSSANSTRVGGNRAEVGAARILAVRPTRECDRPLRRRGRALRSGILVRERARARHAATPARSGGGPGATGGGGRGV